MPFLNCFFFNFIANIGPRTDPRAGGKKGYGSGKQTLRFKANGQAEVEDAVSIFKQINLLIFPWVFRSVWNSK